MPKGAKFIRPSKVHVIVGAADHATIGAGRVPRATIESVTDELHAALQTLFDEAQQRVDSRGRRRRAQPAK